VLRVVSALEDLERDDPAYGPVLLRAPHRAHPALAYTLEEFVGAQDVPNRVNWPVDRLADRQLQQAARAQSEGTAERHPATRTRHERRRHWHGTTETAPNCDGLSRKA